MKAGTRTALPLRITMGVLEDGDHAARLHRSVDVG